MLRLLNKDFRLFIRDHRSVILTFLIPVILITLFAFAYGSFGIFDGRSEPVKMLVADLDQTMISKEILGKIDSLDNVKAISADPVKAREMVTKGKYPCALLINKGVLDSLEAGHAIPIEILYDRARELENAIVIQNLTYVIMSSLEKRVFEVSINRYLKSRFPFFEKSMSDDVLKNLLTDDRERLAIKMTSVVGEKFDTKLGLIQAVAGTAILMLLFSIAGVGASILEEKENGTINRLLYSPLKGSTILFSKMIFAYFISVLQLATMFLYASVFLNLDLSANLPGLILMILATSFAVSGLGIFLAAVAKTRLQAQNMSTVIILVMSAIGGSMIPLFIMPQFLQKMALFSLNYWCIQGFYDIFWRDLPLKEIFPEIIVLISSGIALTITSLGLFRKRILKA